MTPGVPPSLDMLLRRCVRDVERALRATRQVDVVAFEERFARRWPPEVHEMLAVVGVDRCQRFIAQHGETLLATPRGRALVRRLYEVVVPV